MGWEVGHLRTSQTLLTNPSIFSPQKSGSMPGKFEKAKSRIPFSSHGRSSKSFNVSIHLPESVLATRSPHTSIYIIELKLSQFSTHHRRHRVLAEPYDNAPVWYFCVRRKSERMKTLQQKASELSGVSTDDAFAIDDENLFEKLGLQTFINLSTDFYNRHVSVTYNSFKMLGFS